METPNTSLGPVGKTHRGFGIIEFKDRYDAPCSLQMSSIADNPEPGTSAVWLGVDDANPKCLWSDAKKLGVKTNQKCGWVPYAIPPEVSLTTRMHLSRDQVAALIVNLQSWLDTGHFE